MTSQTLIRIMLYVEPAACVGALVLMRRQRQIRHFGYLSGYLFTRVLSFAVLVPLLSMAGTRFFPVRPTYTVYFYGYWLSYAVQALLGFGIVYSVYNLAMAPLKGLQRHGRIMFIWATGIAVVVATTTALGPHVSGLVFMQNAVTQLEKTQSVLTLCLLLFVTLAIRPMGLSYRSRIFGVSLGLGLAATTELVGVAWMPHVKKMVSVYDVIHGSIFLVTLGIWSAYLAMPEPRRRMIILPTTSPFLRWNQISLALGDDPGFVAVGDVTPDMFAPAEVEVMRRASIKLTKVATG